MAARPEAPGAVLPGAVLPGVDFALSELVDLHEVLNTLRAQGPVSLVTFAGAPTWLVTGHDEVREYMADDEYLSAPGAYKELLGPSMGDVLATMTGPQHRHNRAAVAKVFFPKRMRQLAETLFSEEAEKLARGLRGRAEVELMSDFARPYTFNNITRLLGLPATDAALLKDWAARIMHSHVDLPAARDACGEMGEYLGPVVTARRASPGEDMISLLTLAEVDGRGLGDEEIFSFCRNLFPAAIDTSTNGLGILLAVVLEDSGLWRLAAQGEKSREALVDEVLRWESPLVMVPRKCVREVVVGGYTLRPGDDVRLCISAANNDPAVYPSPRRFDPERGAAHLAFGHGEHFCIGSHMARRVMETGLGVLVREFPDLVPDRERQPVIRGGVLRGPDAVWALTGA
jgi:cytochrome P450